MDEFHPSVARNRERERERERERCFVRPAWHGRAVAEEINVTVSQTSHLLPNEKLAEFKKKEKEGMGWEKEEEEEGEWKESNNCSLRDDIFTCPVKNALFVREGIQR
jgi:hypothetical protein